MSADILFVALIILGVVTIFSGILGVSHSFMMVIAFLAIATFIFGISYAIWKDVEDITGKKSYLILAIIIIIIILLSVLFGKNDRLQEEYEFETPFKLGGY